MKRLIQGLSVAVLAVAMASCATSGSVDQKIAAAQAQTQADVNKKIESVASQVETVQQHQKEQDTQIASLSQEAKDALKRATDAGVLAKGKVAFQQTFSQIYNGYLVQFDPTTARQMAYAAINGMVARQAAVLSYIDDFRILAALCVLCIPAGFLFKAVRHAKPIEGAH